MIAHSLSIGRRHLPTRASLLLPGRRDCLGAWLYNSLLLAWKLLVGRAVHCAISAMRSFYSPCGLGLHVVVCDVTALGILRNFLIGGFGMDGDDVPRVQEAGKVCETAERDVDQTVGGTDACDGCQENVAGLCRGMDLPRLTQTAMGGKKMATMPRKISLPHMVIEVLGCSAVR